MRAVVDTNVLLSALLVKGSAPDHVLRAWLADRFILLTSEWQIDEVREVSRRQVLRQRLKTNEVGFLVNRLRRRATVLPGRVRAGLAPDSDDDPLLGLVIEGEADYLVTGDRGLLPLGKVGRAPIVTPRAFLDDLG